MMDKCTNRPVAVEGLVEILVEAGGRMQRQQLLRNLA